jgi:hypothetical protein
MESPVQLEVVRFTVPGPLPSWNEVLAMSHWKRHKFKGQLQESFLSALRISACDSLTMTIAARNSMSIAADTLACYRQMLRTKRESKRAKKKLEALTRNVSR